MKHIYKKLDVSNAIDAVMRINEMDLLNKVFDLSTNK